MGLRPARSIIQTDDMDAPLRNQLWSAIYYQWFKKAMGYGLDYSNDLSSFALQLWVFFFKHPGDEMPSTVREFASYVKREFMGSSWEVAYDLLEEIVQRSPGDFDKTCNIF